jgi:hypothetical protein
MSQMRKDIFTDHWAIVDDGDGLQPTDFHFKKFTKDTGFCPFCESNEGATPGEVFAIRNRASSPNGPGWSVRVVPNSRPRLRIEGGLARRAEVLHDLAQGHVVEARKAANNMGKASAYHRELMLACTQEQNRLTWRRLRGRPNCR